MKYTEFFTIKETKAVLDFFLVSLVLISFFFSFSTQVSAFVKDYLEFWPSANFIYDEYSKENQTTIEIVDTQHVDKIFFNGVESRKKVTVTLEEGKNIFSFILVGRGKEIEETVVITKDTTPPEFMTDFDFKDIRISSSPFSFEGILSEEGIVSINRKNCLALGTILCELEITEETDISVIIEDLAGNVIEKNFKVSLDDTVPTIDISVENPTYQDRVSVTIKGNEALSEVRVNDIKAERIDESKFKIEFTLKLGKNKFTAVAKDKAGNEAIKYFTVTRKEVTSNNNGGSGDNNSDGEDNDSGGGGGGDTQPSCGSISLQLYGVKTPIFIGETQMANVSLKCGNGSPHTGQPVTITVKYAGGTTRSYSSTTNGSGVVSFSFIIENHLGRATLTAKYGLAQTNVTFTIN